MEILERNGSEVIIKRKNGETWLTRRVKRRHDGRRRALFRWSVRYIPIRRITYEGI